MSDDLDLPAVNAKLRELDADLKLAKERHETLAREVKWVRQRLASFYPERHYCPHCKATVHQAAQACGACGRSWGKVKDPNAGLPS